MTKPLLTEVLQATRCGIDAFVLCSEGMGKQKFRTGLEWVFAIVAMGSAAGLARVGFGSEGVVGHVSPLWIAVYCVLLAHLTIAAMSLGFHRQHTHQGVRLHPLVDFLMQAWLWVFTSMAKRDWVSVHVYHHAHSDDPLDPHSPVQKGFWNIFFFGALAYSRAKREPAVARIRQRIPIRGWEAFIERNLLVGPSLLVGLNFVLFGPAAGLVITYFNFAISPLFAVGGVNGLAHFAGYRTHETRDNSRNIGFLFPLNWIVCGELDHNNHHFAPKSCSFRHRWYEFDIGYLYLKALSWVGLAELKSVYRESSAESASKPRALDSVESA